MGLGGASSAQAHAFGERYDLPLPFELYLIGAGTTVGVSFLIIAFFLRPHHADRVLTRVRLGRLPAKARPAYVAVRTAVEASSVALFLLILAAGFLGSERPADNLAPVAVWVVWWVGMAFVSALLGDLWRSINPWSILFRWFEAGLAQLRSGLRPAGKIPYPERLGVWPAVGLFILFAWLELLWPGRTEPRLLAGAIVAYSLATWLGMFAFGRRVWLERGEVFTVYFSLLARFAPLEIGWEGHWPTVYLRPYGVGLLPTRPVSVSFMVFVLSVLATVAFDGFVETPGWFKLMDWLMQSGALRHLLLALQLPPSELIVAVKSVALVLFPAIFTGAFLAAAALMGAAGGLSGGPWLRFGSVAGSFVLLLVPIAIAYHVAHYFLFLLQAGQMMIPLISDPFGFGWDLFGTAAYDPAIGIMNARSVWYLALFAIVVGHIVAVYLAHVMALRLYGAPRAALVSQVPMVALMVAYTVTSLWILSQPIVA